MARKCKTCIKKFEPRGSTLEVCCSIPCAILYARTRAGEKHKTKARRAEVREYRQQTKTRGQLTKEAQIAFNRYIRARDERQPCISCGVYALNQVNYFDAGHYRSLGSCPELRFEPMNCHKQCKKCNQHLSGNIVEYRAGLKDRIGIHSITWLEGPHEAKHYSSHQLIEIRKVYRIMENELHAKN